MSPVQTVVAFTGDWIEIKALRSAAAMYGWNAITATTPTALRSIETDRIAAILFDRQAVRGSWPHAASLLRKVHPGVPLIACLRFSEAGNGPNFGRRVSFMRCIHRCTTTRSAKVLASSGRARGKRSAFRLSGQFLPEWPAPAAATPQHKPACRNIAI